MSSYSYSAAILLPYCRKLLINYGALQIYQEYMFYIFMENNNAFNFRFRVASRMSQCDQLNYFENLIHNIKR